MGSVMGADSVGAQTKGSAVNYLDRYACEYQVPENAEGDARVYGTFPGCLILGHECSIKVGSLEDEIGRAHV